MLKQLQHLQTVRFRVWDREWDMHCFSGKPIPVPHQSHKLGFVFNTQTKLAVFSLKLLPLVVFPQIMAQNASPALL